MLHRARILFTIAAITVLALAPARSRADEKSEMMTWIKDAEQKLVDLSDAVPEGKYSWRPSKGVRSVGEVYLHVAQGNYLVPSLIGTKTAPQGFVVKDYDKSLTKKADIRNALKDSFASLESSLDGLSPADLDKPAEYFGMKSTVRGAYMLLLTHAHEHLGQSIAYARTNGVVPPWTAKEQAAAKDAEKNKDKAAATSSK